MLARVAVGWEPCALCYNTTDNKVYCACFNCREVVVIDGAADSVTATVRGMYNPCALCCNTKENKVYSANQVDDNVTVIDCATESIVDTVAVGETPQALFYNPLNDKVFCANYDGHAVTVIDGATDTVLRTIGVGGNPSAFCLNPVQNRVYVANGSNSTISVLRDSMSGVEESPKPQASGSKPWPTILSGASGVKRLASCVVFDAMGRRVTNARAGVYFVLEEPQASSHKPQAVRKVIVQR